MPKETQIETAPSAVTGTKCIHRLNEFCKKLGIGRSTYYKLLSEGTIEPSLRISKRARGYSDEYLQSLIQKMRGAL